MDILMAQYQKEDNYHKKKVYLKCSDLRKMQKTHMII